jgi:hypothetical protein
MGAASRLELSQEYGAYLARFASLHGEVELGRFVKHGGRLIKKLAFVEFEDLYRDFTDASAAYFESVERGDTLSDVAVRIVRERAAELLLASPI